MVSVHCDSSPALAPHTHWELLSYPIQNRTCLLPCGKYLKLRKKVHSFVDRHSSATFHQSWHWSFCFRWSLPTNSECIFKRNHFYRHSNWSFLIWFPAWQVFVNNWSPFDQPINQLIKYNWNILLSWHWNLILNLFADTISEQTPVCDNHDNLDCVLETYLCVCFFSGDQYSKALQRLTK